MCWVMPDECGRVSYYAHVSETCWSWIGIAVHFSAVTR